MSVVLPSPEGNAPDGTREAAAGSTILDQLLRTTEPASPGHLGTALLKRCASSGSNSSLVPGAVCRKRHGSEGTERQGSDSGQERGSPVGNRPLDEHLQAKRARVESIIRGMSHSPLGVGTVCRGERDDETCIAAGERPCPSDLTEEPGGPPHPPRSSPQSQGPHLPTSQQQRENKRKQRLPQQQSQGSRGTRRSRQGSRQTGEQCAEERRRLKQQLEDLQRQLRQLQEKFFQVYSSSSDSELEDHTGEDSADESASMRVGRHSQLRAPLREAADYFDDARHCSRTAVNDCRFEANDRIHTKCPSRNRVENGQRMHNDLLKEDGDDFAEALKNGLHGAVSQVVDSVVRMFSAKPHSPRLTTAPLQLKTSLVGRPTTNGERHDVKTNNRLSQCLSDVLGRSLDDRPFHVTANATEGYVDQTEALPLVVRKSYSEGRSSKGALFGNHHSDGLPLLCSPGFPGSSLHHLRLPLPLLSSLPKPLCEPGGTATKEGMGSTRKDDGGLSPVLLDLAKDLPGRAQFLGEPPSNTGLVGGPPIAATSPTLTSSSGDGLSTSLVKSECGDLQDTSDVSPYATTTDGLMVQPLLQEGLTPHHLKKAKLMFFYSRYPSSNMLKLYFPDVKFNRCTTSQLIKWFSNFREFYYIQMEKFARAAVTEGLDGETLGVTRDSELFKAINAHYNKSNDFQVPETFLEVAGITLREFYAAVKAGRDADPSWKKFIYKIICKLDSPVPEVFRSPCCLQELLQE
ncbi:prospero homeobox protein 1 [Lampetra fluviatilis]